MVEQVSPVGLEIVKSEETKTTLDKVSGFALRDSRFARIRADLQVIAIKKATFFIDATEAVVHQRAKDLYRKVDNNPFARKDRETFGTLYEVYDDYLDYRAEAKEEGELSDNEANMFFKKEFRKEIALREARIEFANALDYEPGIDQPNSYRGITMNPDFKNASILVLEAIEKLA